MKPPALSKDDDSRLIAYLDTFPYQEGAPRSPIYEEGDTMEVITSSSASYSPERELFTVISGQEDEEEERQDRNLRHEHHPDDVSQDEPTANVVREEIEAQRTRRRARNAASA
uniref:Uncharacterized protein n=1 Tax=Setaria viridis TaxID=4556 RepID=A0A4U6V2T3_SETVI|nr:hypothetical protein SEVIR_4G244801v2 [Setaria viridis]